MFVVDSTISLSSHYRVFNENMYNTEGTSYKEG